MLIRTLCSLNPPSGLISRSEEVLQWIQPTRGETMKNDETRLLVEKPSMFSMGHVTCHMSYVSKSVGQPAFSPQ